MKINKKKQKQKNLILILSFCLLAIICLIGLVQENLTYDIKYRLITSNRSYNSNIIRNLQINEMNCAYDSETNTFFFPQDLKDKGKNILMKTGVLGDSYNISFITDKDIKGIGENYYNINFEEKIRMLVYTDEYYYETNLQFTGLPIINIKTEQEITQEDCLVYSEIIDPYFGERNSEQYIVTNANMHVRGKSSLLYEKKAFKYELIKENGETRNKELLGMRDDDDWVLDALYCDPSNIRNVLCCDLWNEINSLNTTNDYDIDLECEFVEVFINNEYAGIYVLKEPVDAKKVGIEEDDYSSILIKGDEYTATPYNSLETYSSIDTKLRRAYGIYVMEYPKDSTEEKIISDFNYFLDKINPYFDNNITLSLELLEKNFSIHNIVDYLILIDFTDCFDNSGTKNRFFFLNEEGKIIFIPWDLDLSFGMIWKAEILNPVTNTAYAFDYENFDKRFSLDHIGYTKYQEKLHTRYFDLRHKVLNYEKIERLCDNYRTLLIDSGAYGRDSKLYYYYDLEKEIEDILEWSKKRIEYLDEMMNN